MNKGRELERDLLFQKLEEANKEFELLLQNVMCGICIYRVGEDGQLRLEYMSEGFCEFCEAKKEEINALFAENTMFGVEASEKERVWEVFHRALDTTKQEEVTYRAITACGRKKWCTLKLNCIREGNEKTVYATFFDVTKQMQMQRQLEEMVHNVPGAVCFYRWNGVKLIPLVVSDKYSEMLGMDAKVSLEKTRGLQFLHVHPDDLQEVQGVVLEALAGTHKMNYTYRSYNEKKKKYIWINAQANTIPQPDGTQYVYASYTDITLDKRIEEQLRESEQSMEAATKNAGLWYWNYNWRQDVAYMSRQMQIDFGMPCRVDAFVEQWIQAGILNPEYQEPFRQTIERLKTGIRQVSLDARGCFPDGEIHWARFSINNLFDEKGESIKAIGTIRIIDDVKNLEEKYEIERKRGMIGDENLLAHASVNLTRKRMIEYTGREANVEPFEEMSLESIGKKIEAQTLNAEDREKIRKLHNISQMLGRYKNGETEIAMEYRRVLKEKKVIWVRTVFHMLREPNGTDILLFENTYDINKSKSLKIMMELAVNDDYDLLGSVNNRDNSAIMLFGANSYNVFDTNLVEEDYTESLIRFANHAVIQEDREEYYRRASIEHIKQVLGKQEEYEFYFHMMNVKGEVRAKKVRYSRYQDEDIFLFAQSDITLLLEKESRKQNELKHALEQAKIANHSKTAFLAQMSHEIRTPMNAIIGMTQLAGEVDGNPKETQDFLEKIDSSSQYLLGILNDVLDMSRIERGKFELHPLWVRAGEILQSCVEMMLPAMQKKKIHFSYPRAEQVQTMECYVDPLRMKQIYMNLLNNALKFTPEGGTVEVIIRHVEHDNEISTDWFSIRDTGCGMSEEFLKRIFEPFEQEENPYSQNVQGTGLGLALVKKILEEMGGSIQVESKLKYGSTFTFRVPYPYRWTQKTVKKKKEYSRTDLLHGKRILLVDDHPLNLEIAQKVLEKEKIRVTLARDGKEALELFCGSEIFFFDAILMDIRMPVMGGLQSCREIRKLERLDAKKIPIIAMTANAFGEDVKESLAAGMNAHLAKPINPKLIYQTLLEQLS